MQVIKTEGSRPIKAWVGEKVVSCGNVSMGGKDIGVMTFTAPDIEDSALTQLKNLARLPFIAANGVAVMPDVHAGIGSTVGTVIATDKAIIPAAVGVDIGCGMNAVRLSLRADQLPDNLAAIRDAIEKAVPLGAGGGHQSAEQVNRNRAIFGSMKPIDFGDHFDAYHKVVSKAAPQLGTLGSGNHFIELCVDENQQVWVMLHSGSRGIGNMIGKHFIEKAKRNMEKFFISLPDKDLAYFPEETEDFNEYVAAVDWAQNYALENRRVMMRAVIQALHESIPTAFVPTGEAINCHHNYVEKENHFGRNLWVTRKGAVRAREGDLGIIPGSMGQKSYIVRGKGNPESYCSCSHGAGRQMSRTEAKKRFSLVDLVAQTEGVECRKDADVIDEIPSAYKNLDLVMENQKDLVEVVHTLKAVLCVKGN
ncbi:RtcB family protein [Polaromonas sp. P1(28)-13]|nr:RtcB family protein [Polaromonas sp. P1(28)-13]